VRDLLQIIESMILGIIQGLTEFLPISSSGHLVLFRKLMGLQEAGLFLDTMLHLGTLLAVVIIFWQDIVYLLKHPFSRLMQLIVVGTIPTAIIGLSFKDYFETVFKSGSTLGYEFIITGIILWFADKAKKSGYKGMEQITFTDALFVGTLQGAAILPAISRSGLTIAGALFRKIERGVAARFSFLLSLPAILGAAVLQLKDIFTGRAVETVSSSAIIMGTLMAVIAGYIAVKWMIKLLQEGSLKIFSYYVWVVGVLILIAQFFFNW